MTPPPPPHTHTLLTVLGLQNGPAQISDSHSSTVIFDSIRSPKESTVIIVFATINYFAFFTDFVFCQNSHGTATVLFKVAPMECCTSVKEGSTKVIVAKTVIIINHLAAGVMNRDSRSLWNCKIHFATEQ